MCLTGMQTMWAFYLIPLLLTVLMAFVGNGKEKTALQAAGGAKSG